MQNLTNEFWSRWKREFLHSSQKCVHPRRNLEEDDIVLTKDDNVPYNWLLARVISVIQDGDKLVRKVSVAVGDPNLTSKGKRPGTTTVFLERPVQKLVLLTSTSDK